MTPIIRIAPIVAVISIVGCSDDEKRTVAFALKGVGIEDQVTVQELAMANAPVVEAVPEAEPAPAMVQVCWEEPRRAGTWFETVCEMRPAN